MFCFVFLVRECEKGDATGVSPGSTEEVSRIYENGLLINSRERRVGSYVEQETRKKTGRPVEASRRQNMWRDLNLTPPGFDDVPFARAAYDGTLRASLQSRGLTEVERVAVLSFETYDNYVPSPPPSPPSPPPWPPLQPLTPPRPTLTPLTQPTPPPDADQPTSDASSTLRRNGHAAGSSTHSF